MNLLPNPQPYTIESLHPLLVDLNKLSINGTHLTIFDRTNFYASVKTPSVIVLKENDYINLKHLMPVNSNILLVSMENDQMHIIGANIRVHNINFSSVELASRVDQLIVLFLRSHQHPIYEHNDDIYSIPIDNDTLWNVFDNVKITIKMIKNGDFIITQWKGTPFKGLRSEGMEWTY
jgi:hypothetical protein